MSPRRRKVLTLLLAALVISTAAGAAIGRAANRDLPSVRDMENYRPPTVTQIFATDGSLVTLLGADKRIVLKYRDIPKAFIDAVVATEDSRFWHHFGVDVFGLARAAAGSVREGRLGAQGGGSTLTMQLARNLFPHIANPDEKTLRRKMQEVLLALEIERTYSKEEILAFYCNQIYMGPRRYGVEATSRYYFGKPSGEMTLGEVALLAGLIQNPAALSPVTHSERALARRRHVLGRMVEEGMINQAQADAAAAEPLRLADHRSEERLGSFFVEEVRRQLRSRYDEDTLYRQGLRVQTTLDPRLQKAATDALKQGLLELQQRRGWKGRFRSVQAASAASWSDPAWSGPLSLNSIVPAVVLDVDSTHATLRIGERAMNLTGEDMDWSGRRSPASVFRVGDIVPMRIVSAGPSRFQGQVEAPVEVEGAVVAIDPATGEVRALVGGYDFSRSEFNRAVQARRQPGSAFKPFIVSAAFDAGLTPALRLRDEPTVFLSPGAPEPYQPENYHREYGGLVTVRDALEESRNIAAVRLLTQVGPKLVIERARAMGITSSLQPYPSLALGSFEVSPIEMTSAFSVFPNAGVWVEPHLLRSVADANGRTLEEARPASREAMSPASAALLTHLLRGVIESGTAQKAKELGRDVAGKTGTTNDYTDAWFVGFSPSLCVGVWVGLDRKESLGKDETGAHAALPIWMAIMQKALEGHEPESFPAPAGVSLVPVDRRTGLRSGPACPPEEILQEAFLEGTDVLEECSPAEHWRLTLPYFLQRFAVTDNLELAPDPHELASLLRLDRSLRLAAGGRRLETSWGGRSLILPLALADRDRRELLREAALPSDPPQWFGVDGRPAEIIEFDPGGPVQPAAASEPIATQATP